MFLSTDQCSLYASVPCPGENSNRQYHILQYTGHIEIYEKFLGMLKSWQTLTNNKFMRCQRHSRLTKGPDEMRKSSVCFETETVFDEDAIRSMFRAEYFSYERLKMLMRAGIGAFLLFIALFFISSSGLRGVLLLLGCWFLVSTDFPSRMRAEQLIQSRHGQISRVRYRFSEDEVLIDQTGKTLRYDRIDRIMADKKGFYLFESPQNAVMIQRTKWDLRKQQSFADFISEKTGKDWKQSRSFLSMNLKEFLDMIGDRKIKL